MIIVGIDSGKEGYFCELNESDGTCNYLKIPYRDDGIINGFKINRAFENFGNTHKIILEKVKGRGGWGATACFNFGKNYGQLLGILNGEPLVFVNPLMWQKIQHRNTTGATAKERSASVFASLNPTFVSESRRKIPDGLIDAFLIARWGLIDSRIVFRDDWRFFNLEEKLSKHPYQED
jgi:hypothetical protein